MEMISVRIWSDFCKESFNCLEVLAIIKQKKMRNQIAVALCLFTLNACSQINLGKLQEASDKAQGVLFGETSSPTLSNAEIISALKEALVKGAEKSVSLASVQDGFYKNPKLKIPFPKDAEKVKETAINLGLSAQVEKFEETLNRAAEEAAKKATEIFVNAITDMTVQDGANILKGADNAATNYLKSKTTAQLTAEFAPIVDKAIDAVELTKYWTPLVKKYNTATRFTGGEEINTDLNAYVTERAISGLFVHVEAEEKLIRHDPIARVTDLLKKVFGSLDR